MKLLASLAWVIQRLQAIDKEVSRLRQENEKHKEDQKLSAVVQRLSENQTFRQMAKDQGVSIEEWIQDTLIEACRPTRDLPIDPEIYEYIEALARGKGISVREYSTGEHFTELLNELKDNWRL